MKYILTTFLLISICGCFSKSDSARELAPPDFIESDLVTGTHADDASMIADNSLDTTPTSNPIKLPAVEIIWQADNNTVDHFIINYGSTEKTLDKNIKLSIEKLTSYIDPEYGSVHKYILTGTDPKLDLYFNIQAVAGYKISEPSTIQRVAGERVAAE